DLLWSLTVLAPSAGALLDLVPHELRGFPFCPSDDCSPGGAFPFARIRVAAEHFGIFERQSFHDLAERRQFLALGGGNRSLVIFRHQDVETRLRFLVDAVQLRRYRLPNQQIVEADLEFRADGADEWSADRLDRLAAGEPVKCLFVEFEST